MSDTAATSWLSDTAEALSQAVDATKTQAQIENLVDAKESLAGSLEEFRQIARADVVARSLGWPGRTPPPTCSMTSRRLGKRWIRDP